MQLHDQMADAMADWRAGVRGRRVPVHAKGTAFTRARLGIMFQIYTHGFPSRREFQSREKDEVGGKRGERSSMQHTLSQSAFGIGHRTKWHK